MLNLLFHYILLIILDFLFFFKPKFFPNAPLKSEFLHVNSRHNLCPKFPKRWTTNTANMVENNNNKSHL